MRYDIASSTSVVEGSSMATATRGNAVRAGAIRSIGGSKTSALLLSGSPMCGCRPLAAKNGANTSVLSWGMQGAAREWKGRGGGWRDGRKEQMWMCEKDDDNIRDVCCRRRGSMKKRARDGTGFIAKAQADQDEGQAGCFALSVKKDR